MPDLLELLLLLDLEGALVALLGQDLGLLEPLLLAVRLVLGTGVENLGPLEAWVSLLGLDKEFVESEVQLAQSLSENARPQLVPAKR